MLKNPLYRSPCNGMFIFVSYQTRLCHVKRIFKMIKTAIHYLTIYAEYSFVYVLGYFFKQTFQAYNNIY